MTIAELAALSLPAIASVGIILIGRFMTRRDILALEQHEQQECARQQLEADRSQSDTAISLTLPLEWLEHTARDTPLQSFIKDGARDLHRSAQQGRSSIADAEIGRGLSRDALRQISKMLAERKRPRRAR